VNLKIGAGEANPYAQKELFIAVKGLLEETAAYRRFFSSAVNLKKLIDSPP
jgi:hypothetical protein